MTTLFVRPRCCLGLAVLAVLLPGCSRSAPSPPPSPPPHTAADRVELYDWLVAATLQRQAFSGVKNERLGLDFERDARPLRAVFERAGTDLELFRALTQLSGIRRDAHLEVRPLRGGLAVDVTEFGSGLEFVPDFSSADGRGFCVQRLAGNLTHDAGRQPAEGEGDVLLAINGLDLTEFESKIDLFLHYSTAEGRAWSLARALGAQRADWPTMPPDRVFAYRLRSAEGDEYDVRRPARRADELEWPKPGNRTFPGFTARLQRPSFDLYLADDERSVVVFEWHNFAKESLQSDLRVLMEFASTHELLDHDIIVDFTQSRGGADGLLALRCLSPKPFKTTFGNLRCSDLLDEFFESREQSPRLRDWLLNDVAAAQRRGDAYSPPVPFKLRHFDKDSDGVMPPADVHFRGRLVCLFGGSVGSQVDQVASMLIDNGLCHSIGMPTGGYSNTWEWEEHVRFPTTNREAAEFAWSIGQTFRPNGEVLEGNPPVPAEVVPLTRANVAHYYDQLLQRALDYLAAGAR